MQGCSPEPCRRRDCPAQTGWPYRRARWKALRHAVGVTHLQDHELAGKVRGRAFEGVPQTVAVDPSRSLSFASERLFLPLSGPLRQPRGWPGRWQADLQCPLNPSATENPPDPPNRFATRATRSSVLERKSLRRGDM